MVNDSSMVNDGLLLKSIQIIAILANFTVYISGLFENYYRKINFDRKARLIHNCLFTSSFIWSIYGYLINDFVTIYTNIFGCAIEMFILYYNRSKNDPDSINYFKCISCVLSSFFGILLFMNHMEYEHINLVVGIMANISSLFLFIFPLYELNDMLKNKNFHFNQRICSFIEVSIFFNSFIWVIYGLLLRNFFLTAPSLLGMVLMLIRITIVYKLYKNQEKIEKIKKGALLGSFETLIIKPQKP